MLSSYSKLNNWKQQNGLVPVRGVVSEYMKKRKLRRRIEKAYTDEMFELLVDEFGYKRHNLDMRINTPFGSLNRSLEYLERAFKEHDLCGLIYLLSGKFHYENNREKIDRIIEEYNL